MELSRIVFDSSGTLRSGWRFLVFSSLFLLLGLPAGIVVLTVVSSMVRPGTALFLAVNGTVSLCIALFAGWLCAKYLERLPFRSLGASFTRGWFRNLGLGVLIGGLTFSFAAVAGMISGSLDFRPNIGATAGSIGLTMISTLALFALAAAFEEALLRGYIFQTFLRAELLAFAVLFTSTLFATFHNANPNASMLSWVNTFLAGVWLAAAYLKTRDLWLPLGVHLGWNWTQGSVFGVEVSGLAEIVSSPLMRESDLGPSWLTGGDYGIEGGLLCTAALVLSTIAIYLAPGPRPDDELLAMTSPQTAKVSGS